MKQLILHIIFFFLFLPLVLMGQEKNDTYYESIQPLLYENPDKAIVIAKEKISQEENIDAKIKYHLYLSKAYTAKRNFDNSFKTLLEAKELLKNTTNIESKIDVLINISIQYQQMELYNKCFETLDEVDSICNNLDSNFLSKKNSWLGKIFAIRGIIYKSTQNYDIALDKFFKSIENLNKAPQSIPNINNTSIVYYNIGYCYLSLNKTDEAKLFFLKSIEYAKYSNAISLEAYALKGLGDNYFSKNDYKLAIENLENAKIKAKNIGDLVLNEGIFKGLADNYLSIGNFENYITNNELYKKTQFEREQSELKSINSLVNNLSENSKIEVEKKSKNFWIVNFLIISFTLVLSTFLIFKILKMMRENKLKQKRINEIM